MSGKKIDTRAPMFPDEVRRIVNMALYGMDDDEIIAEMGGEIDGGIITERWVRFVAKQARRGAFENPRKTTMATKAKISVTQFHRSIELYVGSKHAGTPDEEIAEATRHAASRDIQLPDGTVARLTKRQIAAAVKYALEVHHKNLKLYRDVMGGRIRNNPRRRRGHRRVRRNPDRKVIAISEHRHRASAAERRLHGGRTVTQFIVHYEGDPVGQWARVTGYGPTPGERKTDAIRRFKASSVSRPNPSEDEFDLQAEMDDGIVISPSGHLGSRLSIATPNRGHVTADSMKSALVSAVEWMEKNKYYPNVFYVNDHGNVGLLAISPRIVNGKILGVRSKIVRSWV